MPVDASEPLRVLILEDEPTDAELEERALRRAGVNFVAKRVEAKAAFVDALESFAPDVALLDYKLPNYDGAEALAHLRHVHPEVPVVIVTGTMGDEAAIELLKAGAKDYVLKNNLVRLAPAVERVISVEQGIRARKSAERAVRQSEEKFRSLVEDISDLIWETDKQGILTYVSPRARDLLGYAPADLVGKSILATVTEAEQPGLVPVMQDIIRKGEKFGLIETQCRRRDGREIAVEVNGNPIFDEAENLTGFRGITRDVTERKQAEQKIREEEERFRSLVEQNVAGVVIIRADGSVGYVNSYFAALNGYTTEELFGRPLLDLVPAAERARVAEQVRSQLSGAVGFVQLDTEVMAKDGHRVDVLVNASPAMFEGQPASIAVIIDITERKRAEKSLKESEDRFRLLVEEAPDAILIYDLAQNRFIDANKAAERLFGTSRDEIVKHGPQHYYSGEQPDGRPVSGSFDEHNQRALNGDPITFERRIQNALGQERLCEVTLVRLPSTRLLRSSFVDVTERRRAQQQLAAQAMILTTQQEVSPDGILVVDRAAKIISVNRRFGEIFQIPAEVIAAGNDEPVLTGVAARTADSEGFLSRVRYLYDHPEQSGHDEIGLRDGRVLDRHTAPMRDPTGKYFGRVWFFRDISEQKRAETALRESQRLIEGILNAIPVRVFWKDRNLVYLGCNEGFAQDAGFVAPEEVVGKDDHQMVWKDRAESYRDNDRSVIEAGSANLLYEEPLTTASGETLTLLMSKIPLRDANGEIVGVLGSYLDITERKAAEQDLRRLNRNLRTLSSGNEVVVRAISEPQLLDEMCRVIVEKGGYPMAWIGLPRDDPGKTVEFVASAGPKAELAANLRISWGDGPLGAGPTGRAIRTGKPQTSEDVINDPLTAPWDAFARKHGIRSTLALPLLRDQRVIAVLVIVAAEAGAFNVSETALLHELADDLAYAIRVLRDRGAHEALDRRWRTSLETTVGAIANTIEVRDPYTAGHQQRVALLAVAMARELKMAEQDIQGLYLAGIIHDIGKITIPAEILNKPGKLSKLEYELIQGHAEAGYNIVKGVDFPWPIAQMMRQHHERIDGSGYPQGLRGEAMLPEAKILAVADVVEAMMSHRPYRPALGIDAALAEIEKNRETLFDSAAVDACVALFREQRFSFDAPPVNRVAAPEGAAPKTVLLGAA